MIADRASASVYTDFQGLVRLRAEAGRETPQAIKETARQFEALFVQMMLKAMRDASPGDGMFDSDQVGFYREMYDRQLALELVKGRGLGVADTLARELGGETEPTKPGALRDHGLRANDPAPAGFPAPPRPPAVDDIHSTERPQHDWEPQTPAEFVRELWPHARRAAGILGVDPQVLVAQAALETGWGRRLIRHPDGRNSFNLFNIKADVRWQGERVNVTTLEYENGAAARQRAAFRGYDSVAAAVDDYVGFLRENPRYRHALELAANPQDFLQGLKDAGYATDPDYVEKISDIMNMNSFHQQISELKQSAGAMPG